MPVNAQQYEVAKRGLQAAVDEPDAFSEAEIRQLSKIVSDFQDESIKIEKPLGEGGSMFGDTGMDMLEKRITSPEQHGTRDKMRAENPMIAKALNLSSEAQPVIPDETNEEKDARYLEYRDKYFDDNLPNASKRKDLSAPPEFHVQAPTPQATNPLEAFSSSIGKARENLPAFAGGKVEHYLEPPVAQFQRDMAPVLGPRVANMGIETDEYKEYADQLWQDIYNKAQQEGRSVVRTRYKEAKSWRDKAEGAAAEGIGALAGAARGVDEAAFGGVASEMAATLSGGGDEQVKNFKRLSESNEIAHTAGQVVGGAASLGAGTLASKGITKALGGLAGYGSAALRGGLAAAGSGAAATASMAAADDRMPGWGELALGAGLGLPFGLLGGVHGKQLRDSTALGQVERAGVGETSMLSGIKKTRTGEAISERAQFRMGQPGREVDMLGKDLEKPLATAGRGLETGTARDIGEEQSKYFSLMEDERKPLGSFVKDALDIRKNLTTPDGRALPRKDANIKFLDDLIDSTSTAEIVPAAGGEPLVRSATPGTINVTPEEAARMGINVEHKVAAYMASGNEAPGENFMVRIKPRELNPRELESFKKQMDLELKMGNNPNKEEMNPLLRRTREARDQFPAEGATATVDTGIEKIPLKGFSAQQRLASEKTADVKRRLGMAGLPDNIPETLNDDQATRFQSSIRGYRQAGRAPDVDDALRELAGLAGKSKDLETVAGMRGLDELGGGIPLSRKSLLEGARLRLDPALQFLGPAMGAAMPGAYQRSQGPQLPPQLDQAMIDRHRKVMGPFGPF